MGKVKGKIEIDAEKGTVSIRLENGSYCYDYYTHGMKRFLDDEIECIKQNGAEVHTPKDWEVIEFQFSPIINEND